MFAAHRLTTMPRHRGSGASSLFAVPVDSGPIAKMGSLQAQLPRRYGDPGGGAVVAPTDWAICRSQRARRVLDSLADVSWLHPLRCRSNEGGRGFKMT